MSADAGAYPSPLDPASRVVVTGGGSGIGLAVATAIVEGGGAVVVVGRRREPLEAFAARYPKRAFALPCDLSQPAARSGLLDRAAALLGGITGLVHSAGTVVHQAFGHIDEAALREQLELNLVAPLRLGEEALTVLPRGGAMVFVSSTLAHRPLPTSAAYSAAKAGMLSAMRALALAGAERGIRANAVVPGVVDTDMIRALRLRPGEAEPSGADRSARIDAQLDSLRSLHPLGRLGAPADIADAVLHLLRAPWTTGAELTVDGGLLLRE